MILSDFRNAKNGKIEGQSKHGKASIPLIDAINTFAVIKHAVHHSL